MLKFLAITAALLAGVPASAQTVPAQQQPAAVPKAQDPNRIICERQEELGSRLGGKKVCMTAKEWDDQRRMNRESTEMLQRMETSTGKPGG